MSAIDPRFPELLTPSQVARALNLDSKTITRWAAAGKIRSVRLPSGHRRYYAADIDALVNGGAQEPGR